MSTSSPQNSGDSASSHDSSYHGPVGGPSRYTAAYGQDRDGYGPGQHGGPVSAPPQLKKLLTLTLVSAGLYLLNGIASAVLTATMDLTEMYERMGMSAEEAQQAGAMVGQMGNLTLLSSLIVLAVALGLYALVYVFLKKGANWARILGIVLAIVSSVSFLFGFFSSWLYGGWGIVLIAIGVVFIVVNIVWLVTAFKARRFQGIVATGDSGGFESSF